MHQDEVTCRRGWRVQALNDTGRERQPVPPCLNLAGVNTDMTWIYGKNRKAAALARSWPVIRYCQSCGTVEISFWAVYPLFSRANELTKTNDVTFATDHLATRKAGGAKFKLCRFQIAGNRARYGDIACEGSLSNSEVFNMER